MVCSKLNKKSRVLLLRQVPTHPLSPHLTMQLRVTLDLMFLPSLLGYEIVDMYQQHIQFVLRTNSRLSACQEALHPMSEILKANTWVLINTYSINLNSVSTLTLWLQ